MILNAGSYFYLQKQNQLLSEICLFGEETQLFQPKSTLKAGVIWSRLGGVERRMKRETEKDRKAERDR